MASAEQVSRRLKLRHLHVLRAVVEHGSMMKAAEQLAVSQPVVSKAIADLEQTLGVRLLERGKRGADHLWQRVPQAQYSSFRRSQDKRQRA